MKKEQINNSDKKSKVKKNTNGKSFLYKLFCVFISIIILLGAGLYVFKTYMVPRGTPQSYGSLSNYINFIPPGSTFPDGKNSFNILLLGMDQNWTDQNIMYTKGARTDTMMVVHLDLDKKRVGLLSIPRDSKVPIPGYYEEKINAAFSLGGVDLAKKTVESVLQIPIDYYVVVKIQALPKVIDAVNGVEVCVEKDMDYDDNWGHLHIHLKEGWQTLDGDRAVQYSRFRKDEEGDLGRIRRQQQVIYALKDKVARSTGLIEIKNIIDVAYENVETNLSTMQILELASIYKNIKVSDIKMATVPTYSDESTGVSYQIIDSSVLPDYINEYLLGIKSPVTIEILNGNGAEQGAGHLRSELIALGFKVVDVKNADSFDYNTSQVILHKKLDTDVTEPVVKILGKPDVINSEESSYVDITIILGKDFTSNSQASGY